MSSLIYNSFLFNSIRSMIHFDTDSFKVILVSSTYKASKNHSKLSDILYEVPESISYKRGGLPVDVRIQRDETNNRVNISLAGATWENATITAAGAIYYKEGSEDLVCFIEFVNNVTKSENGTFSVTPSVVRIQN